MRGRRIIPAGFMLMAAIIATHIGSGVSRAEESKTAFDAHDTGIRYHFNDTDMDFNFGTIVLGSAVNHGVEIGEAFYAASKIKDGNAASWQKAWFQLAKLVEARGEASLAAGHRVSARDQLQRAAYYYRISLLSILPTDPRLKERAGKSRSLLKKAGTLFDPPLEYFEIPFEGTVLPGYFRKAARNETRQNPDHDWRRRNLRRRPRILHRPPDP